MTDDIKFQRQAASTVADLALKYDMTQDERVALSEVLSALPKELTVEYTKGVYVDQRGLDGSLWRVEADGTDPHRESGLDAVPSNLLPLTQLAPVPTAGQLFAAFNRSGRMVPSLWWFQNLAHELKKEILP